jgi:hypothetical protein
MIVLISGPRTTVAEDAPITLRRGIKPKLGGLFVVLLVIVALLFPGVLLVLLLVMEQVEHRLGRDILTDQVEWMLRSELPVEAVETTVAERLTAPLASVVDEART